MKIIMGVEVALHRGPNPCVVSTVYVQALVEIMARDVSRTEGPQRARKQERQLRTPHT